MELHINDIDRIHDLIIKVGPEVEKIFKEIKYGLGGILPKELMNGIVAGYLRGKGYTWEESFIGMYKFDSVIEKICGDQDPSEGEFRIYGQKDGNIKISHGDKRPKN